MAAFDWSVIKTEYITTQISQRDLAKKYGVNATTLAKRAKAENWVEARKQNASKTLAKTLDVLARQQAARTATLYEAGDKLLGRVMLMLDSHSELLESPRCLRDISGILRDLKEIQGLKSAVDLREQEARIDKLRADAQKNEVDETQSIEVVFAAGPEEWNE